jgi:hypothetical protein
VVVGGDAKHVRRGALHRGVNGARTQRTPPLDQQIP